MKTEYNTHLNLLEHLSLQKNTAQTVKAHLP